jgi:hypothetical protein
MANALKITSCIIIFTKETNKKVLLNQANTVYCKILSSYWLIFFYYAHYWLMIFRRNLVVARVSCETLFRFGSKRNQMKHQAVLVMYRFVSWNYRIFVSHPDLKLSETPETSLNRPKWRLKRQKKTNQSKTKRNKVKQSTKTIKWGNSRWDCVFTVVLHPKLLVSVQPKRRNLLFCYFVKQLKLSTLFWIVSKLVSVQVSDVLILTEFRTVGLHESQNLCLFSCFASKVFSFGSTETPTLAVSLFRKTTETNFCFGKCQN